MPKVFNRAIQVAGEYLKVGTYYQNVISFDADGSVARAVGKNVPADGDKGFAKGCEYVRATGEIVGNTGPRKYVNIGNEVKAKFVPVMVGNKAVFEEFRARPVAYNDAGYGDPTGSTGDINLLQTDDNTFEYHIKGTQTLLAPSFGTNGLNVGLDQTDNDGVELNHGVTARQKTAFTVGTDPAFYFSVQFHIEDVSGTDDCAIGFRKVEANQANIDDYDEMAALNVISGDIKIETILNNAATVTTDTTQDWADDTTHTLTVKVDANGRVTYEIDGAAPTVAAAFSFDAGEVVMPFFFFLHASDVAGIVNIKKWEVGYL